MDEPQLVEKLAELGCTGITVEGVCWSFDPPGGGRRWAGGVGAVKQYIERGGPTADAWRGKVGPVVDFTNRVR